MKRPRDSQRSRVYRAEKMIHPGSLWRPTIPEIEAFLRQVIESEWFRKNYPGIRFAIVEDGRGKRRGKGDRIYKGASLGWGAWMTLPKATRHEAYILHELAHSIVLPCYAWHGPEYCEVFIQLVQQFMGQRTAHKLTEAYQSCGVRIASGSHPRFPKEESFIAG